MTSRFTRPLIARSPVELRPWSPAEKVRCQSTRHQILEVLDFLVIVQTESASNQSPGPIRVICGKLAADEVGRSTPVGITEPSQRANLEGIVRAWRQISKGPFLGTRDGDGRPRRRRRPVYFDAVTHVEAEGLRKLLWLDHDSS